MCAPFAGSERRWQGGGVGCWEGYTQNNRKQGLVVEVEKELCEPWGGSESDSSRAIREVKQLIIT